MKKPTRPIPAKGHMPFPGHRSQAEVREDEEYFERVSERSAA